MTCFKLRVSNVAKCRFAMLFSLLPMLSYAHSDLPIRAGFYSSGSCKDPANAALLHFDGKKLTGAHSAACHDEMVKLGLHVFRVVETCPAERLANAGPVNAISISQNLTVQSVTSFALVDAGRPNAPVRYRFCGTTLDRHGSN
jgi:hypothetical protein